MRLRGEREVTSQADTVIEIGAMNRYIHDGTAARASRASYEVIAASYIRRGVCVWGEGVSTLRVPLNRGWAVL